MKLWAVVTSAWRKSSRSQAPQRDLTWAVAITLVAALVRLFVVLRFSGEPVWDGHYYHFGAVRLASGLGYSEDVIKQGVLVWKPWTHYPVGYSFWLSLWYRVFGPKLWVAPLSNAVVGTATVFLIHGVALPFLGAWRARLAALFAALHPGLVLYTAVAMSEPLAAGLLIASAWPLLYVRRRILAACIAGVCLGASVLVRPSSLVALPLYWLVVNGSPGAHAEHRNESDTSSDAPTDSRRESRAWIQNVVHRLGYREPRAWVETIVHRLGLCAVITACCFATLLPWTLRNCYRMDGCALVSTNAGWNLAIGALTETGRFRTLRAADGCKIVTGQVQQDRCWWQRGVAEIRRDPWRWLQLAPKKLAQTFDHESFAVEYLREANPKAWPEAKRVAWREILTDAHRWMVVLASFAAASIIVGQRWYRSVAFYVQSTLLLALALFAYAVLNHDEHPIYWLLLALVALAPLPLPGKPNQGGIVGFALGFTALTAMTHVLFFGDDRYHLVVSPLLCLLAAAALRVRRLTTAVE